LFSRAARWFLSLICDSLLPFPSLLLWTPFGAQELFFKKKFAGALQCYLREKKNAQGLTERILHKKKVELKL